jgi:hypothetical protein
LARQGPSQHPREYEKCGLGRQRYETLIEQSLIDLLENPERSGVTIVAGRIHYHLRYSRRRAGVPLATVRGHAGRLHLAGGDNPLGLSPGQSKTRHVLQGRMGHAWRATPPLCRAHTGCAGPTISATNSPCLSHPTLASSVMLAVPCPFDSEALAGVQAFYPVRVCEVGPCHP